MPQQLYKPAEACKIAEVAPYVLRYWETEFPALSEGKEKAGPRAYTERDVRVIARIRELLYDEGFTVAGAKKRLEAELAEGRFDDGLKVAPPPAEQRGARKGEPAKPAPVSQPASPARPSRPPATAPSGPVLAVAKNSAPAPDPGPGRSSAAVAVRSDGEEAAAERKRVIRELKDIVRILERSHRR
jgi:DNA-binding transcriptional MerR regulator